MREAAISRRRRITRRLSAVGTAAERQSAAAVPPGQPPEQPNGLNGRLEPACSNNGRQRQLPLARRDLTQPNHKGISVNYDKTVFYTDSFAERRFTRAQRLRMGLRTGSAVRCAVRQGLEPAGGRQQEYR
ncbi:hypothetical protein EVAR_3149_1 [Eumeta japonica]|uniref:Uncharacterized protein n=1 Tax=Eumeta variegata TaxID=151549 RepID=A0A4C1XJK0_EUMVA|nr:hypothetical protein EVAR_3149_1 [Eumeta japonica]